MSLCRTPSSQLARQFHASHVDNWQALLSVGTSARKQQTEMKNLNVNYLAGVALIVGAVALTSDPVYTSIKGAVVDAGGPIGLGVAVGIALVVIALVSGIVLLRKA